MIGAQVVAEARRWIGTPYCHQASCRGAGADCLGVFRGVWRALFGAEPICLPPYSPDWAETSGDEVLLAAARRLLVARDLGPPCPGDVLIFRMRAGAMAKHLALATGPCMIIHAYSGVGVVETPLSAPWARRVVARFEFPSQRI